MAKSKRQLHEGIRTKFMALISECLSGQGEEVLAVGSNELAIPTLDEEGNEEFLVLTFKVPTGSRDGDPYDGYGMAQSYEMKVQADAEKKAEAERKKQAKIARDAEARKQKAEARAKAKAEEEGE